MNDPATIGVALAIVAEMRWALARLDRKVAALDEGKADKPSRRGHAIARAGLWVIAGMLLLTGCARGASPDLAPLLVPPAAAVATPTATAVLTVLPWAAGILAVGGVVCAVLAIALREVRWLLGTAAAAAGILAALALEWVIPYLPWLILAGVAAGASYGAWRLVLYRRAIIAAADHGDRMEAVQIGPAPAPVEVAVAKLTSLRDQAAAGVHGIIAAARNKPLKANP